MMDVLNDSSSELQIGASMESLEKLLESQKEIVHKQIDQLQNIINIQCKLTGVNPLSQEMAAGALSIKIGKRPRDMLNPKAVKYMQSVFSVKDVISKKECREIGALFGVTVTQVRDYFNNQRSRVRKIVRLSRDKVIRANIDSEFQEDMPGTSDRMQSIDPVPLSSAGPSSAEDAPSCSNQDDVLPGLGESEKQFVENIFSAMRKEETFSGQVKLLEWILQIENPAVLCWFLTKGGVMILATWLTQAASEEQTTVLSLTLKVLCHLPLVKALPTHMSAILQAVNKLRFYRISDISNRARVLVAKWSKMLTKSQPSRKPNGLKPGSVQETNLRQRIGELIGDDSWQTSLENHERALVTSHSGADDTRKMETQQDVKLLTASSDDSNKKLMLGASSIQNKERRKVQLVEQPGQKQAAKSQPVKPAAANQARPITADEIQKAKLRKQLMQNNKTKSEGPKKPSLLTNDLLSASEAYLRPKLEAQKKARVLPPKISKPAEPLSDQKPATGTKEPTTKEPTLDKDKCRKARIPWRVPPEFEANAAWEVGTGSNSKEVEAQKNRTRREKETTFKSLQEIPSNPKEPWDMEMDYDDSLTPEIPIEQLPDAEDVDMTDAPLNPPSVPVLPLENPPPTSAEPDLELLAVLLKNPDLVFALSKGQAGLSSEDTVRFLDALKANGGGLLGGLSNNKPASTMMMENKKKVEVSVSLPSPTPHRNVEGEEGMSLPSPTPPNRFEVSLPSPTPPSASNHGPSGWATQVAAVQTPFSRRLGGQTAAVISSDNNRLLVQNSSNALTPAFVSPQTPTTTSIDRPPAVNSSSYGTSSLPGVFQPQVYAQTRAHDPPYEAPEAPVLNSRHGPGSTGSFSARADPNPNLYDHHHRGPLPASRDFYRGTRNGFDSWAPDPEENHRGRNYQEPRSRGYGHPTDRHHNSRHQNLPGYRDQNWYAGGGGGRNGGNRRWHDGDRRW